MQTAFVNCTVVTMDHQARVLHDGVVLVEGSRIKDVGPAKLLQLYPEARVIDAEAGILFPGMVNGHCHLPMVVFRGLADDEPDRLKRFIFPLEKKSVDQHLVATASRYAIAELLLGGVTTVLDMYYFEEQVARAADELGIRAIVAETVINFPGPGDEQPYCGIERGQQLISDWAGHALITPTIAPHAPYTNDSASLQRCHQLTSRHKLPLTMHVAEMDYEERAIRQQYGTTVVGYLDSLGLLDERFIAAHAIRLNEADLRLLVQRGSSVVHNVGANSKSAKGVAPVLDLLDLGGKVGLGSDGPMSGNRLDIITQMDLFCKVHKLWHHDRSLCPARLAVELATIRGAEALGMNEQIGSIEVGKQADLVLVETRSVNMQPLYDPYSALVYAATPLNVDTVMVAGQLLVQKGTLLSAKLDELRAQLLQTQNKIKVYLGEL